MNSTKMFSRVVPALSPRARTALGGAPLELVDKLMSGHDVGLTHRVLEGLGAACEELEAPIAAVVEATQLAGAGGDLGALVMRIREWRRCDGPMLRCRVPSRL